MDSEAHQALIKVKDAIEDYIRTTGRDEISTFIGMIKVFDWIFVNKDEGVPKDAMLSRASEYHAILNNTEETPYHVRHPDTIAFLENLKKTAKPQLIEIINELVGRYRTDTAPAA